jgi:hypothetical protein
MSRSNAQPAWLRSEPASQSTNNSVTRVSGAEFASQPMALVRVRGTFDAAAVAGLDARS